MGYFKDEGLTPSAPTLIRGWSPLVEAFAAGKFNLVHLLKPIPVWMRYNNHFPVKIMAWAHTNGSGLVVGGTAASNRSPISGQADRGAVLVFDAQHRAAIRAAPIGHQAGDQVDSATARGRRMQCCRSCAPPDMPAALAAKKIDGYIVAEPFNALGEMKAGGRMLRFTGDIWKNHPCCVICMHEQNTKERPEWTQKVAERAGAGGNLRVAEQGRSCRPALARRQGLSADAVRRGGKGHDRLRRTSMARAAPSSIRLWHNGRIDFQPWPYPSATKFIVAAMNETLVDGDTTFLRKSRSGFCRQRSR